jgi:hypothetical protein
LIDLPALDGAGVDHIPLRLVFEVLKLGEPPFAALAGDGFGNLGLGVQQLRINFIEVIELCVFVRLQIGHEGLLQCHWSLWLESHHFVVSVCHPLSSLCFRTD